MVDMEAQGLFPDCSTHVLVAFTSSGKMAAPHNKRLQLRDRLQERTGRLSIIVLSGNEHLSDVEVIYLSSDCEVKP